MLTATASARPRLLARLLRPGAGRAVLLLTGILAVFSALRIATNVSMLTSSGTLTAAIISTVPVALAGLGGLWSERSGVVNIGLEGSMILGTFGAGWIGWQHGPWAGVLAGVLLGGLGGLVHAVATVTFGVDHIIAGVALNILALGATQFLASLFLTGTPGGGKTQSPPVRPLTTISVPGASSVLQPIEDRHWFFVSDLAALLRALLTNLSSLTVIAVILVLATYVVLWKTSFGLRVRTCGEDPYAAETLGINVVRAKFIAVTTSGALAGFGGVFLALVAANLYREGQTGGRGYVGLGAVIFGNWRPGGMVAGSSLFGYIDALQLRSAAGPRALLLIVAGVLFVTGFRAARKRSYRAGLGLLLAAAGTAAWFRSVASLPAQVTFIAPYVATLIVLAIAGKAFRPPKSDGVIYRRGQEP